MMKLDLNRVLTFKIILYSFLVYFIYLLGLITFQYIPINDEEAFLNLKQDVIVLPYYKLAFYAHVYSSFVIISLGLTQFSTTIRTRFPSVHKLNGKVYVLLTLVVASPSGFIIAYHANGGVIPQISFSILSILWFIFTLRAYQFIKKGDYQRHRNFMIRSYALTLSAVSLRLFKYVIISIWELPPIDTYRIVAVLSWTFNLGIAELIIRKTTEHQ